MQSSAGWCFDVTRARRGKLGRFAHYTHFIFLVRTSNCHVRVRGRQVSWRATILPISTCLRRTERSLESFNRARLSTGVGCRVGVHVEATCGVVEGDMFCGTVIGCVGGAGDEGLLCGMAVDEICHFWSTDHRAAIGRTVINFWASLGDKWIL